MSQASSIAKNTIVLYLRLIFGILVSFFTTRIVWEQLGIDNYGIFVLVSGMVGMFSFLNSAMVASSQRFISYELGTANLERLKRVFSISVTVHRYLALIILFLAETVGLWFLNYKLNIAADRIYAANWVYQCSIFVMIFSVISVPYSACIVAHERISIYGYYGILEIGLKLLIVFLLMISPIDKLILYSILLLMVSAFMRFIYGRYCVKHFEECRSKHMRDNALVKSMFSFAGWSFFGNLGFAARTQGENILTNLFFGVAMNGARGIANQVTGIIQGFAGNFQMAINPQITKRYAKGDLSGMFNLINKGCKFSFFLMLIFYVPAFIAAEPLLRFWLTEYSSYSIIFIRLMLTLCLIDSLVGPITTALQATGNIKSFQLLIALIMVLTIPASWIWLKFQHNPYIPSWIAILSSIIALYTRLVLLKKETGFPIGSFLKGTIIRVIFTTLCVILPSYALFLLYPVNNIGQIILFGGVVLSFSCIVIYSIGLTATEKIYVSNAVKTRTEKIRSIFHSKNRM